VADSKFPANFIWGASTAAYQVEGAAREDGRGESIWDRFSHTPGKVLNGDTGDVAADHYHRFREDIALMRELGVDAYRFSIAWPRIIPAGSGAVNQKGIDFYKRLLDALLEAGIEPWATLYHWDLPQPLQDAGGWTNRDTVERFCEYADVITKALGDQVNHWFTVNEPWIVSFLGYGIGVHAPGERDWKTMLIVLHNLLLAHGRGVQAIRANVPDGDVGLVLNSSDVRPASDSDADREAAMRWDGFLNRWILDPVTGRGYPEDVIHAFGDLAPLVQPGDLDQIAAPTDFLALNYYFPNYIRAGSESDLLRATQAEAPAKFPRTATNWPVDPTGLTAMLLRMDRNYHFPALYVVENGAAFIDPEPVDGRIIDPQRVSYLERHIAAVHDALTQGAPVKGYFIWSLLDNFEWNSGYSKRFGIVHVDYPTQARTIKDSGRRYAEIIAASR
jgi:beta-glucosidase